MWRFLKELSRENKISIDLTISIIRNVIYMYINTILYIFLNCVNALIINVLCRSVLGAKDGSHIFFYSLLCFYTASLER